MSKSKKWFVFTLIKLHSFPIQIQELGGSFSDYFYSILKFVSVIYNITETNDYLVVKKELFNSNWGITWIGPAKYQTFWNISEIIFG